ncbi:hypothetical protein HF086_017293 [Spodoptera exigua]|uniref:Uncharacterized protein n=1 Tax=Spodoptera exigua TaxID=7107 RepID=A0A922M0T2_SPOEX|nr:hypothetical protein HF086_017293 [Spodoptera exigua]
MVSWVAAVLVISAAVVSAYPAKDPVIGKWSEGLRYDYLEDDAGKVHLVDNWMKISDFDRLARYNPDASNRYHLFTSNTGLYHLTTNPMHPYSRG